MASPFAVFRRNQRAMMAFLCLVAMGAFVLVNPWNIGSNRGSGRTGHDVAVRSKYGDVSESELQMLVAARHGLARLLMEVVVSAEETRARREFKPTSTDPKQQELELARELQQVQYYGQKLGDDIAKRLLRDSGGQTREIDAMNSYILANKAKELGMTVGDKAAMEFLRSMTGGILVDADYKRILQGLQRAMHIGEDALFEALNRELLANRLLNAVLFDARAELAPPAARLEHYSRIKQSAIIEAMPLNVAEFAGEVPEPKDAELVSLFEKGKNRYAVPESSEPGFMIPQKIKFEYAKIAMSPLIELAKTRVTDKEIKDYYEAHRDLFRVTELPLDRRGADKADASSKSDEKSTPTTSDASKGSETSSPDDSSRDINEEPAATSKEDAAPVDSTIPESGDSTKQSRRSTATRFQLTSYVDDADSTTKDADSDTNSAADAAKSDKNDALKDDSASDTGASTESGSSGSSSASGGARYEPLDKVREQIISQLARTKAGQLRREAVENLREEMNGYAERLVNYEARDEDSSEPPPPRLNLADVAARQKGYEIQVAATDAFVDPLEAGRTEIGQSHHEDGRGRLAIPFVNVAFSDSLAEFDPRITFADNGETTFVYWKTDHASERVPELNDVRPQVVDAYKMLKARELAEKKAQELAKEARSSKQTLRELFGGRPDHEFKVERVGPFSWMSTGTAGPGFESRLRRTDIKEIPYAGDDFMKTVFSLAEGAVDIAFNEPKTVVYVVRPYSIDPPRETLQLDFARNRSQDYLAIAREENGEAVSNWFQVLREESKVEWQRDPDVSRRVARE